jgi:hypothetical protein
MDLNVLVSFLYKRNKLTNTQWEIGWTKVQEVILPNHGFRFFIQKSIPQLRKSHTRKPFVTCHFPGTCLQSKNFGENLDLFSQQSGQLSSQKSPLLLGICSAYIYSFERFFSQVFNDVYDYFVSFQVFELED